MKPKNPDLEKISDTNILNFYLENIQKGKIIGSRRKTLARRGLIEYSHKNKKFQLTPKAHKLLGPT